MPIFLNNADETMKLGRILAQAMCCSSVRTLYLSAPLGGGKTTLTRGFVSALPGGEDAEVASPSFTLCNVYPTNPEVLHADLYRLGKETSLPEEMEEMLEEDSPLLILEWPEYLAEDERASERLEVTLTPVAVNDAKNLDNAEKSCKSCRLATLNGCGDAALALLGELLPRLEKYFLPDDEA